MNALPPLQVRTPRCVPGGKMPGVSPRSHIASGGGTSKPGTSARRHHERALAVFEPARSTPAQRRDPQAPRPRVEDSLLKR